MVNREAFVSIIKMIIRDSRTVPHNRIAILPNQDVAKAYGIWDVCWIRSDDQCCWRMRNSEDVTYDVIRGLLVDVGWESVGTVIEEVFNTSKCLVWWLNKRCGPAQIVSKCPREV